MILVIGYHRYTARYQATDGLPEWCRNMSNCIEGSTEFKCCKRTTNSFSETAEITSSTNRFQNEGLTGAVVRALCSRPSTTKLAMTAEIGKPIAVSKTCL